jgi:glycosyltransferase involved in cell wall biosynthesis
VRVLLDTTPLAHGPSGTAVYVERLAQALREEGVDVVEHANARRGLPGTGRSLRNLAADVRYTQADLRRSGVDVIHHPLPTLTVGTRIAQVVTVHDLAFEALPHAFDPRFRAYARLVHRQAARHAQTVITPSAATARDLRERWGVVNAHVIPHGPGQELRVERREPPRHFLYVGDDEPRKDLPTLLAAYAHYRARTRDPLDLVLAGKARADGPGVRTVAAPDAAALADLHARARALVHPSRHEGFGLTVLEALTAGTPVICTDLPVLREVAGDAASYVPSGDVVALAWALRTPPEPGAPPPRRTWRDAAREHVAAYRHALAAR